MSPEERAQAEEMQRKMQDLGYLAMKLKPSPDEPDAVVSTFSVIEALASCPMLMHQLGQTPEFAEGADGQKQKEEWVSSWAKLDASLEEALVEAKAFGSDACDKLDPKVKHIVLLLYWHMHQANMPELSATCAAPPRTHRAKRTNNNK